MAESTVSGTSVAGERKSRRAIFVPRMLRKLAFLIESGLNKGLFSGGSESLEKTAAGILTQRGQTVALAESCTGGLLAHRLTNVPGSSDFFLFSGVAYSNQAKMDVLGVSADTLKRHGAVHENTAAEMARGARLAGRATYGLSTTGIAGPSGGTREKPVGTVCIGLATSEKAFGRKFVFPSLDRETNKRAFAERALEVLLEELGKDGFGFDSPRH